MNCCYLPVLFSLERLENDDRTIAVNGLPVGLKSLSEQIQCSPIANMPSTNNFRDSQLIKAGKYIFSFGGRQALLSNGASAHHWNILDEVYRYDMEDDTWTQMASMLEAKLFFGLTQISDEEILISGKLCDKTQDSNSQRCSMEDHFPFQVGTQVQLNLSLQKYTI